MIPKEILEEKNKNFIVSMFDITEQDMKSVNIINSYERFYKRNNPKFNYIEYNPILENQKKIENTEIYINGKNIYKFVYRYHFENQENILLYINLTNH